MPDPLDSFRRGDFKAAARTLLPLYLANRRNSALALYAGAALLKTGREAAGLAVLSLGDDAGGAVRGAFRDPRAPAEIRALSKEADAALRRHFTALHACALEGADGADRVRRAIWVQTHDAPFDFLTPHQAPTIFYMPDLPAAPVTATDAFSWTRGLEAAAHVIRGEYEAARARNFQQTPYVPAETSSPQWARLRGALDWSAIHLYNRAKRTPAASFFPKTLEALGAVDLVRMDGAPVEVFFSRLAPGAHIPPHFGLTNSRLTVHLPLIVPEDCAIRVADATHQWTEGRLVAFDDSFEHEAWNRSARDRVVLIFECHHPDLTNAERAAVEASWSARQAWLDGRLAAIGAA